jgi:response regulator RpfG family c-di-GMP phosphodiesterase
MEVVFIDGNDKQRGLYRIYLENILEDCQVHEFFSLKNATDFLNKNSSKGGRPFAFILVNTNAKDGDLGQFYQEFHEQYKTVPFVVFSEEPLEMIGGLEGMLNHHPQNSHIQIPISPADFRERVLEVVYPDRMNLTPVPAFQKVRLFNFYRFNKPQCHVYIKLSRMKYVKVFNQGIKYSRVELDRLKAKEVDFLYIRNEDFQRFQVNFFRNNFLEFDAEEATPDELKEKLDFTHAMLHELVLNLGFSEDAIELTEKSLQAIFGVVEKEPNIGDLISRFRGRDDYLYDHSYLTSVIACDLLRKMNWWSEERMEVLSFAALFHDITLTDTQLAKVGHKDDERLKHYGENDVKKYLRHPLDAFELILEYPNIPSKVAEIICQHHETPEGDGFPNSLRPSNIDALSAVFIMAHEFVNALEEFGYDEEKVDEIINSMRQRFDVGPFKAPLKAFLSRYEEAA